MRCHLGIEKRFLTPENQIKLGMHTKLETFHIEDLDIFCLYPTKAVYIDINLHVDFVESEMVDPPLIYLFEDDHQTSDSAALVYQLYRNEKIQ